MAKALVVVESPAKGQDDQQVSGQGLQGRGLDGPHPGSAEEQARGGRRGWASLPVYDVIPARKKVIKSLKDAAKNVEHIYVATDPDREGEAIGWHLAKELGTKKRKVSRSCSTRSPGLGGAGGPRATRGNRPADGRCPAGPPGAGPAGRLQVKPLALGQGSPRAERRSGPVRRPQARVRPRGRDRGVRGRGVLAHHGPVEPGPVPPEFDVRLVKRGKDAVKVSRARPTPRPLLATPRVGRRSSSRLGDDEGAQATTPHRPTSLASSNRRRASPSSAP